MLLIIKLMFAFVNTFCLKLQITYFKAIRVQVGNHDFFINLLFYNRELSCLVTFELKLGEFKAEYLGKMNLYLEALDRDVKKEQENQSVGVILCSSKDKDVVEY